MTELILVRHGQANSDARDEASYDRLSDLGHQQARWLGEYFTSTGQRFDRVITGSLARQAETARSMGYQAFTQDPRLDELKYFHIAQAAEAECNLPAPDTPRDFARYLPQVIQHWANGDLDAVPETYSEFANRAGALVDELCLSGGRHLLVTSGGVISVIIARVLALNPHATALLMLQVMNSSVHQVVHVHDTLMLSGFNAIPHLADPTRADARTYI